MLKKKKPKSDVHTIQPVGGPWLPEAADKPKSVVKAVKTAIKKATKG